MSDPDLEARLDAIERRLTDGDHDFGDLADAATLREDLDALERDLAELDEQVADLEASVQAVRGYVGNVRSVNEDVERRADAALAKAESLEGDLSGDHSPAAGPVHGRADASRSAEGDDIDAPSTADRGADPPADVDRTERGSERHARDGRRRGRRASPPAGTGRDHRSGSANADSDPRRERASDRQAPGTVARRVAGDGGRDDGYRAGHRQNATTSEDSGILSRVRDML